MTDERSPDDLLERLLTLEAEGEEAGVDDAQARVWGALASRLPPGGDEGGPGGDGSPPAGPPPSSASGTVWGAPHAAALVAALGVGFVAGVVMDRSLREAAPPPPTSTEAASAETARDAMGGDDATRPRGVDRGGSGPGARSERAEDAAATTRAAAEEGPDAGAAPRVARDRPGPSRTVLGRRATPRAERPSAASAPALDRERALIDRGRAALAAGRPADALAATQAHAEAHPAGRFVEERERLAIEALAALGRREEAHRRAAAFLTRHPESIHRGPLERLRERLGDP